MTEAYRAGQAKEGSRGPWIVHVLLERPIAPPLDALRDAVRRRCGAVDELGGGEKGVLSFAHPRLRSVLGVPPLTSILMTDRAPDPDECEPSLQQTWDWPEAREVVARCGVTWFVTDMMATGVPIPERFDRFVRTLQATLDVVPALAVHWLSAQRFVPPVRFTEEAGLPPLHLGAVNVRLFRVGDGGTGEMVMDTIGMAGFDLPDVQMHFRELDPGAVAARLQHVARYSYERGDVIQDGHTVDGLSPGERWTCQHERALVGPDRVVLGVHPGRHAAGR